MKNKIIIPVAVAIIAIIAVVLLIKPSAVPNENPGDNMGNPPPAPAPNPTQAMTPPPAKKVPPPPTSKIPAPNEQVPPKTPTNFTVSAVNSGRVKLRWKSADAPDVDGFHVSRSTRSDFADGKIIQPISELDTETFYFTVYDATIVPGATYWYRVTSYNEAGDSAATSPISIAVVLPPPPAAPDPVSVSISNFAYAPQGITVKKGTKVTWTNLDSASHTVTSDSGAGPTSSLLPQGATYSYTFNTSGTYNYHCSPHPAMTGTIIVTE